MAANLNSLGFPVFDADNHLYETTDALTKFLPPEYKGAIDYVDVHGRTKIVVRGQISDYIPNPTFDRVGRPGAQEEYFKIGNPEGKSYREIIGRGIDCPPAFREAGPPPRAARRAGHRLRHHAAHPGQPGRGAHAGRSRPVRRRHPRPQPLDARGVALRLQGPHLLDADHHPGSARQGARGARLRLEPTTPGSS